MDTKGWVCGVMEKDMIGLDHRPGATPKRSWTGKYAQLSSKALISLLVVNAARKELHLSFNQPMTADRSSSE
jgi:hypothetical protein